MRQTQSLTKELLDTVWAGLTVDEKLRATLGFLHKLTLSPDEVSAKDIWTLREAGVCEEAIVDAIYVWVVFSIAVRFADALGFDVPLPERMARDARRML